MDILSAELDANCQIHGQQTLKERDRNIEKFQADKETVIICMIQSGGVGISLHDTHGIRPRIRIISPQWSAQILVQSLGRIYRSGCKSKCIQKILYCSGCVEERVQKVLEKKIKTYANFNTGEK
jgi:SNF2 family DNA or RNA helicase